jgi:hypothetical protein
VLLAEPTWVAKAWALFHSWVLLLLINSEQQSLNIPGSFQFCSVLNGVAFHWMIWRKVSSITFKCLYSLSRWAPIVFDKAKLFRKLLHFNLFTYLIFLCLLLPFGEKLLLYNEPTDIFLVAGLTKLLDWLKSIIQTVLAIPLFLLIVYTSFLPWEHRIHQLTCVVRVFGESTNNVWLRHPFGSVDTFPGLDRLAKLVNQLWRMK